MKLANVKSRLSKMGVELKENEDLNNRHYSNFEAIIGDTRIRMVVCNTLERVIQFKNTVHVNGLKGTAYPKTFKKAIELAKTNLPCQ